MGQIIKIQCIDSSERTKKFSSRLMMLDTIEALVSNLQLLEAGLKHVDCDSVDFGNTCTKLTSLQRREIMTESYR